MVAPISACLITKNESPHIGELLRQLRPHVAEICVVDTGSSDDTPELCRSIADKVEVFTACNDSEGRIANFAMARDRSFSLASQPWVIWIDSDDTIARPENLERLVAQSGDGPAMCLLPYDYAHDHHGNVTCVFWRERIVRRPEAFHWVGPVHEVLVPRAGDVPKFMSEEVRIVHRRQKVQRGPQESGRNLRILKQWYAEHGESDARQLYYLGLEYGNAGQHEEALRFHKRYIELSGWEDEKCLSCLEVSKLYALRNEHELSIEWALKAMTIREDWGEPYYALARSYYFLAMKTGDRRQWERCARFARRYLDTPPTKTVLFLNPTERSVDVHRYMNMALNFTGDVHGALASCEAALSVTPDDGNLAYNRAIYVEHIEKAAIKASVQKLVSVGKLAEEAAAVTIAAVDGKVAIKKQADVVREAGAIAGGRQGAVIEYQGTGLDIVLYTGQAYERWNPETLAKGGMGGSETMAWEMARRLVRLGHRVRVFADCAGLEGTFDGVEWVDHTRYGRTACDVLITSRRPDAVDDVAEVSARATFCWVHDVHCGALLNYKRALRIDRFLCLSEWHRSFFLQTYPFVHPSQVIVTRNGIDLPLYSAEVVRVPHRMVCSSSPDRYLQTLLMAMPTIRARVPDATLAVYYGFDNWKKSHDPAQVAAAEALEKLCADTEGVTNHGRVSAGELAKAQLSAGVWSYSTWFSETSCLSAMQAQAAGMRMVTSPIAALNETAGERAVMIPGDWMSEEYRAKAVDAIVDAMTRVGDDDRKALQSYAREHFSLDTLARDWHVMLHRVIHEVERDVVPPYKAAS